MAKLGKVRFLKQTASIAAYCIAVCGRMVMAGWRYHPKMNKRTITNASANCGAVVIVTEQSYLRCTVLATHQ